MSTPHMRRICGRRHGTARAGAALEQQGGALKHAKRALGPRGGERHVRSWATVPTRACTSGGGRAPGSSSSRRRGSTARSRNTPQGAGRGMSTCGEVLEGGGAWREGQKHLEEVGVVDPEDAVVEAGGGARVVLRRREETYMWGGAYAPTGGRFEVLVPGVSRSTLRLKGGVEAPAAPRAAAASSAACRGPSRRRASASWPTGS